MVILTFESAKMGKIFTDYLAFATLSSTHKWPRCARLGTTSDSNFYKPTLSSLASVRVRRDTIMLAKFPFFALIKGTYYPRDIDEGDVAQAISRTITLFL